MSADLDTIERRAATGDLTRESALAALARLAEIVRHLLDPDG